MTEKSSGAHDNLQNAIADTHREAPAWSAGDDRRQGRAPTDCRKSG